MNLTRTELQACNQYLDAHFDAVLASGATPIAAESYKPALDGKPVDVADVVRALIPLTLASMSKDGSDPIYRDESSQLYDLVRSRLATIAFAKVDAANKAAMKAVRDAAFPPPGAPAPPGQPRTGPKPDGKNDDDDDDPPAKVVVEPGGATSQVEVSIPIVAKDKSSKVVWAKEIKASVTITADGKLGEVGADFSVVTVELKKLGIPLEIEVSVDIKSLPKLVDRGALIDKVLETVKVEVTYKVRKYGSLKASGSGLSWEIPFDFF